METLFWISFLSVFYAYLGYPLLMRVIACFAGREIRRGDAAALPSVSLLISAYNEEKTIEAKILNSLSLDYPGELLEIIVISDGSSDRTDEIASAYAGHGVRIRSFTGRIGKTACLNQVVPEIGSEIIIFSDANSIYDRDALRNLVEPFANPRIGFTTGGTRYAEGPGGASSIGMYAALEKFTKLAESRAGSCVGADGAIFAIRARLFRPLLDTDINDFVLPLQIVRQGYRGVFQERAFCVEQPAGSSLGEFRRQVRITNRTLRALFRHADLLDPFSYGMFSFQLFSHKAAKFLAPFFALAFTVSAMLLASTHFFYLLVFAGLLAVIMLAVIEPLAGRVAFLAEICSFCGTFVATNLAVLAGWFQFLRGETYTVWSPVKR
jgi:cellulose synthase/poly-beta-1,6-N-acetylglucosamine synthase-like glycosyltransferase